MTQFRKRLFRILLALPLFVLVMVLVHEAGHAVTATYATDGDVHVSLWPGYELYPDPGAEYPGAWPARTPALTAVDFPAPAPVPLSVLASKGFPDYVRIDQRDIDALRRHDSLIKLMGSGSTLLLSLLSLLVLSLCRPNGALLSMLAGGALLHLDMLTYATLPTFLGVRHLYWIGGKTSEPVEALTSLGIAEANSVAAIIVLSLLQFAWLYYLLAFRRRGYLPALPFEVRASHFPPS